MTSKRWCTFFILVASAGCSPRSAPVGKIQRPPTLDLGSDTAWPAHFLQQPVWREAAQGDDIDLARLAHQQPMTELLAALDHGGNLGRTALGAIGWSEERYASRGALCSRLVLCEGASLERLLGALHKSLYDANRSVEALDSRADQACHRALLGVSQRPGLSPPARDLIASSQVALGLAPTPAH